MLHQPAAESYSTYWGWISARHDNRSCICRSFCCLQQQSTTGLRTQKPYSTTQDSALCRVFQNMLSNLLIICGTQMVPTTPACTWWNRPEEDLSSGKIGVNSSIQGPSSSRWSFFMESSQLYAATLTHYSTEPLTTGPNYDPTTSAVSPSPVMCTRTLGPLRYPCSVCFKKRPLTKVPAACVQDVRIGYIQDVLVI